MQFTVTIPNPIKSIKRKAQDAVVGNLYKDTTNNIFGLSSFPSNVFIDPQLAYNIASRLAALQYDLNFDYASRKIVERQTKAAKAEMEKLTGQFDKNGQLIKEGELQRDGMRLVEFLADGGRYRRLNGTFTREHERMIDSWIMVESANMDALYQKIYEKSEIYRLLDAFLENIFPLK